MLKMWKMKQDTTMRRLWLLRKPTSRRPRNCERERRNSEGFTKRDVPHNDRKNGAKAFKDKAPCSKCGQRGHWHRDKDNSGKFICPQADKPWPKSRPKTGPHRRKPGRKKKMKKSRAGVGRLRRKPKKGKCRQTRKKRQSRLGE